MKELAQRFLQYAVDKSYMFTTIEDFRDNACRSIKLKRFTEFCNIENLSTNEINQLASYLNMVDFI